MDGKNKPQRRREKWKPVQTIPSRWGNIFRLLSFCNLNMLFKKEVWFSRECVTRNGLLRNVYFTWSLDVRLSFKGACFQLYGWPNQIQSINVSSSSSSSFSSSSPGDLMNNRIKTDLHCKWINTDYILSGLALYVIMYLHNKCFLSLEYRLMFDLGLCLALSLFPGSF